MTPFHTLAQKAQAALILRQRQAARREEGRVHEGPAPETPETETAEVVAVEGPTS